MAAKNNSTFEAWYLAVFILGFVGIIAFFSWSVDRSVPAKSTFPDIGKVGTISMGKPGLTVPVATDEGALRDMVAAYSAKDEYGVSELTNAGKVFDVQPGTQAKYLDANWTGGFHLRILSGIHTGEAVWLPHEFFKYQ